MKWNNPFKGKTQEEKNKEAYERALRQFETIKQTWTKDDTKTRKQITDAILKILQDGGIESFEDDECKIPTTKETLEGKNVTELTEQFDQILQAIRGQIV